MFSLFNKVYAYDIRYTRDYDLQSLIISASQFEPHCEASLS